MPINNSKIQKFYIKLWTLPYFENRYWVLYPALHLLLKIEISLTPSSLNTHNHLLFTVVYAPQVTLWRGKNSNILWDSLKRNVFICNLSEGYSSLITDVNLTQPIRQIALILVFAAFKSQVGPHFVFAQMFHWTRFQHWGDSKCSWAFQMKNQPKLFLKSIRLALTMYSINLIDNW